MPPYESNNTKKAPVQQSMEDPDKKTNSGSPGYNSLDDSEPAAPDVVVSQPDGCCIVMGGSNTAPACQSMTACLSSLGDCVCQCCEKVGQGCEALCRVLECCGSAC